MAAVFIEGIIFLLLAVTGFRVKFAQMIPQRYCVQLLTDPIALR